MRWSQRSYANSIYCYNEGTKVGSKTEMHELTNEPDRVTLFFGMAWSHVYDITIIFT